MWVDLRPDHLLPISTPVFPDYTANYQKTVVEPEQARLAAQEALERARDAEAVQQTAPAPVVVSAPPPAPTQVVSVGGNCDSWMAAAGITDVADASRIISRESGCNPNSRNPYSGACGIGQQLPCGKWPHQWNDPVGGMIDMQNYVYGRYGSWANAWAYWQAHSNY